MSSLNMNNVLWVSSAVVAGILGAAGIFLISHINSEKHRSHNVNDNSETLRSQISILQKEIDNLRELQKQTAQKKKRNRQQKQNYSMSYASDTDTADFRSVIGTDIESDDEFYDVSDTEDDVTITEDVDSSSDPLGWIKSSLEDNDSLVNNGSDSEVKEAYENLLNIKDCRKPLTDFQTSEILWRLTRCCQRMANVCEQNNDTKRKKDIIAEGVEYSQEALNRDNDNYNCHKWYAIIVGMRSKHLGPSERIKDGNTYLYHIQEALKLMPSDASLHHLQGRFKYELSALSWFERKAAVALFGDIPNTNYEEALNDFLTADKLIKINWKENKLYVAKSYIGMKMYQDAVNWLEETVEIENKMSDDYVADKEAKELLEKYRN